MPIHPNSKTIVQSILLLSLLSTLVILSFFYLRSTHPYLFTNLRSQITSVFPSPLTSPIPSTQSTQNPLPTRSPYPLIPNQGTAGTYTISQGINEKLTFTRAIIDPLTDSLKTPINITLTLNSATPISQLTGVVQTDSKSIPIQFKRQKRTDNQEIWQTTYQLASPALYTYIINLSATNSERKSEVAIGLRTQ